MSNLSHTLAEQLRDAVAVSVATLYGALSPNYLSARTWAITAPRPLELHKWGSRCPAKPDGHWGIAAFSVGR